MSTLRPGQAVECALMPIMDKIVATEPIRVPVMVKAQPRWCRHALIQQHEEHPETKRGVER